MYLFLIQARTSSSRLPNKVLLRFNNLSVIEIIILRLKSLKVKKKIIVLTSNHKSDDKIERICRSRKIDYLRGSLNNVASRFYKAILKYKKYSHFVRISADSPVIDVKILESMLKNKYLKYDIVSNVKKKTYPKGQSFEVVKNEFFLKNFYKIKSKSEKEHVTKKLYKIKPFIKNFKNTYNLGKSSLSLDNREDLFFFTYFFKKYKNKYLNFKKILRIRDQYEKN